MPRRQPRQSQSPNLCQRADNTAAPLGYCYARHCTYHFILKRIIQVRVFRGDKYFAAECFDLPVVTQVATLDELFSNIKEAIALELEGENPADFGLAPNASILASYELEGHINLRGALSDGTRQTLTVPNHRELDRGTLLGIYEQALRYLTAEVLAPHFFHQ